MEPVSIDGLPHLLEERRATDEQIADYRRDGHILLRGVASAEEAAAYRPFIADAVEQFRKGVKSLEQRDTYGKAFIQLGNLWKLSEEVRYFVMARRFAKLAAELMEVKGVRFFFDQALFKEPGGGFTPWHQDQTYWALDTHHTITMWMPLVDIVPEMGIMTFGSGTQNMDDISRLIISDESERHFRRFIDEQRIPLAAYGAMSAGDATFHAGWTLHSASANTTSRLREVMTVVYFADGARLVPPDSPVRQAIQEAYFPGLKPGDPAVSATTPLLYSSESGGMAL